MRRRDFITLLSGAAAAWPLAGRAQPAAKPAIGYIGFGSLENSVLYLAAFRKGLGDTGFVEGQNVTHILVLKASNSLEIDAIFATLARDHPDALFVFPDSFFNTRRVQLATLAARHAIPTTFAVREYADAGGLMSYGTSLADMHRQVGVYTGRILKGAKPADLPVVQSVKFELVVNASTARMLGLTVPDTLLALADEVIE
jgi:ABC-type uncharacterized transport system substrate-binding protein